MSWHPEPRPDWVQAVNDGAILPMTLEADRLRVGALVHDVAAELGVTVQSVLGEWTPGSGEFRPYILLRHDLVGAPADLTIFGRWFTRRFLMRLIAGRCQMAKYMRDDPATAEEQVVAPLIVAGAPRTGTTFLHGLLALDPGLRAPEGWELLYPCPPPTTGWLPLEQARIELAEIELSMPQLVSSKMLSIHRYSARMYKECLSAMSFAFQSEEFISRYNVPNYVGWLQQSDMTPAYAMHRQVLQILQRKQPTPRWVLKSPVHLNNLPTVFETYPDAKVIITHRDPLTVLASVTSLVATLRWAQSDHVDIAAIGAYHAELYTRSLNQLVDLTDRGDIPQDQIVHIDHDDLIANPGKQIAGAFELLGIPFTGEYAATLQAELAKPRDAAAEPHTYDFDDLGIDRTETEAALQPYSDRFGVGP